MNKFINIAEMLNKPELSIIVEAIIDNKELCDRIGITNNEPYSFGLYLPYSIAVSNNINGANLLISSLDEFAKVTKQKKYKVKILSINNLIKN